MSGSSDWEEFASGKPTGHFSYFWRYFAICLTIVLAVVGVWYRTAALARRMEILAEEQKRLELQSETLASDFSGVLTDLLVLSGDSAIRALVNHMTEDSVEGDAAVEEQRMRVEQEFVNFAVNKQAYDQLRLLDLRGNELVRVNYAKGQARPVPRDLLQIKSDRYYVSDTVKLGAHEIFVSRFDLNVEDGKIEQPIKPTIRFGKPVFDAQGEKRAILVLNYLGSGLLARFARLGSQAHGAPMLLDSSGYWLWRGAPEWEWGFMFPGGETKRFSTQFPQEWEGVASHQPLISSNRGIFSVVRFDVLEAINRLKLVEKASSGSAPPQVLQWSLISHLSPDAMKSSLRRLQDSARFLFLSGILASYIVGLIAGRLHDRGRSSELRLLESESRFRQMAEHVSEVFWMGTANRERLLYASPAFAVIWGGEAKTPFSSQAWLDAVAPEDRVVLSRLADLPPEGQAFEVEYRITRKDGQIRRIRDRGNPLPSTGQGQAMYVGIADDITDYQEMMHRMLRTERLAAVGEAIAGIAHESRNALQRAQACLEMTAKRVGDRPEVLSLAHRTQEALRDLHKLYERVREYAAPITLRKKPEDLRFLWRQTCRELQELISSRNALIVEGEGFSEPRMLTVDALAIRQVFRNVLENALSEELDASVVRAQVEVRIVLGQTTWNNQPMYELLISDNGPGLSAELCEKIFEPFYTTKARGTGLGMAISRRMVAAHDGIMEARPVTPQGLEIRLLLPRGQT